MFLFRLLSFGLRVVGSFFFVFLLQIQFDGKTLESYISNFGKSFVVTRTLHKVSEDGVKVIRSLSSSEQAQSESRRELSSSEAVKYIKDWGQRFSLPESEQTKENSSP